MNQNASINLLTFLQNGNVVVVRNGYEFYAFVELLKRRKLDDLLPSLGGNKLDYGSVCAFLKPLYAKWDGETLYFECQIGKEKIGIYPYNDPKAVMDWYGKEPMCIDDFKEWPPRPYYEFWEFAAIDEADAMGIELDDEKADKVAEWVMQDDTLQGYISDTVRGFIDEITKEGK